MQSGTIGYDQDVMLMLLVYLSLASCNVMNVVIRLFLF